MKQPSLPTLMQAATARTVEEVVSQPGTWLMWEKYNGIRAIMWHGQLLSRTLKPFPNWSLNSQAESLYAQGLLCHGDEIELLILDLGGLALPLEDIQSVVMSKYKPWNDLVSQGQFVIWGRYGEQLGTVGPVQALYKGTAVRLPLPVTLIGDTPYAISSAQGAYASVWASGGEGLIFRKLEAGYKHGRSTLKQGSMIKVKPLLDAEFQVVGVQKEIAKDGSPKDTLGALLLATKDPQGRTVEFSVGSGFTKKQRKELWLKDLLGKKVNISFASRFSKTNVPQFPVFNYIRETL